MTAPVGALVGSAGGVGTTRLAVEVGAALAADGRDVVVADAALGTQGLASHVGGRVEPDATAVALDEAAPEAALVEHPGVDLGAEAGSLSCLPAHAPYGRIAAAQAPDAAERYQAALEGLAAAHHVVVDVPTPTSNAAVAGAPAADDRAVVAVPGTRGRDALSRTRGTLADLGLSADLVVENRAVQDGLAEADVTVPESGVGDVPAVPACLGDDPGFGPAVATLAEGLLGTELDVDLGAGPLAAVRDLLP